MMGIRQLRTLVGIADCGSFSAAAQRLFLTQSAVSMQMKTLENELQTILFDRVTRPPVLNVAGWKLVEEARAIVERYDRLRQVAAVPSERLTGIVHLGVVPSIATQLLPNTLLYLQGVHADLQIQARSGLSQELLLKVHRHQLDIAMVTEPDRIDPVAAFEPIFTEQFKLITHRDWADMPVGDMFATLSFIRFNPAIGIGRIVDEYLRSRKIAVNDKMEFDTIEPIVGIVQKKFGIAIVPELSIPRSLDPILQAVALAPPLTRRVGLVALRSVFDQPALRAVVEAFKTTCSNQGT